MKCHIHIGHHFFGAGNFGDDLMLAGFLKVVRPHLDKIRLTCCIPHDPSSQIFRFPEIEWLVYDTVVREQTIKGCDIWLGLGDSPFQTDVGMWLLNHLEQELQFCQRYNKPMFFLCVGINNVEVFEHSQTQALLNYSAHVWTRDNQTANFLSKLVDAPKITVGADLAHIFLRQYRFDAVEQRTLGYVLIFENKDLFEIAALYQLIDRMNGRAQRWLIQEVRTLPGSEYDLYENLDSRYKSLLEVRSPDYNNDSLDQYLKRWGVPEVLVTSRYHAAIIGAWMGCRVVPIERNDKIRGLAAQMKMKSLDGFTSISQIHEAVEQSSMIPRTELTALAECASTCCNDFLARTGVASV